MQSMSKIKIEEQIKELLPSWEFKNNFLFKEFAFKNFIDAFSFMTAIAGKPT
jgi:pterin-4a-carbinolamine dehydratase